MAGLQTEFTFTLPKGYVDGDGVLHRVGTMRLATARDEIEPLRDPRVEGADDPYLTILVISDMSGAELSRWTFNNVWPSKWSASDLDVGSDDLMTEEVTLAVEELIRNK